MPSTRRVPGRAHEALASTACTGTPSGSTPLRHQLVREGLAARTVVAARRDHDDVRLGGVHVVPGDPPRLLAARAEHRDAARELDHLRDPVAGRERRVGPLQEHHARPVLAPGRARPDRREPPALVGHELGRLLVVPGGLAQRLDRAEHLVERVGVDGQHLGRAAQVGEGVVDDRDVDRADGAQVLGDDEVGVQPGQRTLVEVVEVVAAPHRLHHEGVDLGRRQPLGHRARRDDAPGAGLLRVVALERHAHHVVTRPDREEDLRRRREERDDAHGGHATSVVSRLVAGAPRTSTTERGGSRLVAGAPRTSTTESHLRLACCAWTTRRTPCWRCSRWRGWRRGSSTRWWVAAG